MDVPAATKVENFYFLVPVWFVPHPKRCETTDLLRTAILTHVSDARAQQCVWVVVIFLPTSISAVTI